MTSKTASGLYGFAVVVLAAMQVARMWTDYVPELAEYPVATFFGSFIGLVAIFAYMYKEKK